jgi:hypothetical protein
MGRGCASYVGVTALSLRRNAAVLLQGDRWGFWYSERDVRHALPVVARRRPNIVIRRNPPLALVLGQHHEKTRPQRPIGPDLNARRPHVSTEGEIGSRMPAPLS